MNIYLLHFSTVIFRQQEVILHFRLIFEHRTVCRQLSVSTRELAKFTYIWQVLEHYFLKSKASNAIFTDSISLIFISFWIAF